MSEFDPKWPFMCSVRGYSSHENRTLVTIPADVDLAPWNAKFGNPTI
jgi:hypothetical protein